jgi:hypothetical protein
MSWKLEIYRAFFVTFGVFQIISNMSYLWIKDGIELSTRQHKEIPKGVTKKKLKIKVIFMLVFGLLFFTTGIYSFISHYVNEKCFLAVLIAFAIYALGEGVYYKYWKTIGFSIVSILVLLLFIF